MSIILSAVTTETIIGIIAIIVIVISLGVIIATAVRNYMLNKKAQIDEQNILEENNAEVQDIEIGEINEEKGQVNKEVAITSEEVENAQTEDISDEFIEKETDTNVQEIEVNIDSKANNSVIEDKIEITTDIDNVVHNEDIAKEFEKDN